MVHFPAWAAIVRTLYVLFLAFCPALLHAQPATVWTYKGSILTLAQSGADVTITYQTLSDALKEAGAHPGDPLFRGRRTGNALSGKVYRFFGGQCQPMGFGVEGTIENGTIILRGIAPSLGLNSCNVVTTFYDNLLLTQAAAQEPPQPARAAPAALSAPSAMPVYLLFPFLCVMRNGEPVFTPASEPYYHEALEYRPSEIYSICSAEKGFWGESVIPACQAVGLSSYRLVCKDGIASAPQLTRANTTKFAKAARVEDDHVLAPFFSRWRTSDEPEQFHRLPDGWGIAPQERAKFAAKDLPILFANKSIPVTGELSQDMPQSFFVTLADHAPVPQILLLPILFAAAVLGGFGFSLYPGSALAPRGWIFWGWLAIATLGVSSALTTGDTIKDAFAQGQREAAAIAADQAKLQSLFPKQDGHVLPFPQRDLEVARELLRPRTIISAADVAAGVPSRALFYLLPALAFLIAYARFMFAGYHYLFVRHPAEAVAAPALQSGALFDRRKLAGTLAGVPIEADAGLAEVAMRRDRARAAQAEAEREWREARKKLP